MSLQTELADLALSMRADIEAIQSASAGFTTTSRKVSAMVRAGALKSKARRWRKLMAQLVCSEVARAEAEAERNAMLEPGLVRPEAIEARAA